MTREFSKWARKQRLQVASLKLAALEFLDGKVDASLGGYLCKKRISVPGRGKRGGARTIVFYIKNKRMIFLHGFLKNEKSTLSVKEELAFKQLAKILFDLNDQQYSTAVANNDFVEIHL